MVNHALSATGTNIFRKREIKESRKRRVLGSAFLCVMKRLFERSGLILFQLRAKAGGFIAADSGKAKEGHVKRFKDVIFHTIPLVLFCPFLMEMKSVDFYCKQRRFAVCDKTGSSHGSRGGYISVRRRGVWRLAERIEENRFIEVGREELLGEGAYCSLLAGANQALDR